MNSTNEENNSPNNSDLDDSDWTLLSPPHSSSSSPERGRTVNTPKPEPTATNRSTNPTRSSPEPSEPATDDGLMEIDLNDANRQVTTTNSPTTTTTDSTTHTENNKFKVEQDDDDDDELPSTSSSSSSSSDSSVCGFQAVDTTSDEDEEGDEYEDEDEYENEEDIPSSTQKASSLSDILLREYVRVGRKLVSDDVDDEELEPSNSTFNEVTTMPLAKRHILETERRLEFLKEKLCRNFDQLGEARRIIRSDPASRSIFEFVAGLSRKELNSPDQSNSGGSSLFGNKLILNVAILFLSAGVFYLMTSSQLSRLRASSSSSSSTSDSQWSRLFANNKIKLGAPTSQQYLELEQLQDELKQCIKRQSPASFKYYMSKERYKDSDLLSQLTSNSVNSKRGRGLVCYGQESQWRKRFDKLKLEFNLDLANLVSEAKRLVTNELLTHYHPAFQFKLLLNQLEYLDFLENKREKKQSEETIKFLRSENLQLLRRISQPNETGYQKLVINLELKNSQLIRENEALKASLVQKAGPTYIKQSLELEGVERENIMLKQFHHQVAKDVSKSLKQFNLYTIDAATILDDQESLNSQLILTRGHLRRLGDKISALLLENQSLKEELKETYLLTTSLMNKSNLPATKQEANNNNNNNNNLHFRGNNNSNALIIDVCARNLADFKEKTSRLEKEVEKLKRECLALKSMHKNELERSNGHHLNRTYNDNKAENWIYSALNWINPSTVTAIDKHNKHEAQVFKNDENLVDELMSFLTKFNNQIEKSNNELAKLDYQKLLQEDGFSSGVMSKPSSRVGDDIIQVIPNYLREIVQKKRGENSNNYNDKNCRNNHNNNNMKLPPIQPIIDRQSPMSRQFSNLNETIEVVENNKNSNSRRLKSNSSSPKPIRKQNKHMLNKNNNNSSSILELNNLNATIRDSWFFKRAQQRRQLRQNKINLKNAWILKRAELREKLRKASSYINHNNNYNNYHHDYNRRPEVAPKMKRQSSSSESSDQEENRKRQKLKPQQKQQRNNFFYSNYQFSY